MRRLFIILSFLLFATVTFSYASQNSQIDNTSKIEQNANDTHEPKPLTVMLKDFLKTTGIYAILNPENAHKAGDKEINKFADSWGRIIMFVIVFILFYLAIVKEFEPLLLLPIGFGGLLANIPVANMTGDDGFLGIIYNMGIANEFFPLLIFMGVGAMTDFGPLLSNPKTAILGGAAQFGIFGSLVGAAALSQYTPLADFTMKQCAAISIIGGADGPTSIFIASALSPELLGAIAVAAYSYMALVPVIQPPIMRALTTEEERRIVMPKLREVNRREKLIFPLIIVMISAMLLPESTPLIGAFAFGNFAKESGVVDRLSNEMQNSLINIVTIFLGLGVGSKLQADKFLAIDTLGILIIGLVAFGVGTASGIIMAKIMNFFSKEPINPLIGAAGVSAVPMSARVVNRVGSEARPGNVLLMHAMGPNVAGVIGSAVAAGVLLSIFN